jgi:hypothetical protein
VIGLPLRLLAREVYDKIVALRGPSVVALVTGEERIVPERTRYWVCTVEAMPEGLGADFLAIDEIQLCADPERGHVFTDRLLRAGQHETLFLGSTPCAGRSPRWCRACSSCTASGCRAELYRLEKGQPDAAASAIVGFSVENLYAIAELLRRQKGGAAVVMGALSAPDAQRAGGAVPERRRRPSGGHGRHRHGAEPRYRARRLLGAAEVRRAPDAGPCAERAGADRGPRRAASGPTAPSA